MEGQQLFTELTKANAAIERLQVEARERTAAFELVEKINAGLQAEIEHLRNAIKAYIDAEETLDSQVAFTELERAVGN
jgi:hypothetical protein